MDIIKKYFGDIQEFNNPKSDKEISALEESLETKLPEDYKSFLKRVNGFEGKIEQSYVRLNSIEEIENYTRDYCSEFYPDKTREIQIQNLAWFQQSVTKTTMLNLVIRLMIFLNNLLKEHF